MPTIQGLLRVSLALLCAAVMTACANLQAVRDFAANSAQLTAYQDVTQRYLSSPDRITRRIPSGTTFDQDRRDVEAVKRLVENDKQSLLRLHSVATGYMAALAALAGEDAFDLSGDIDRVTGAISASSLGLNAGHVGAFGAIAQEVTSWTLAAKQAREVKTMVRQYGDAMDVLLDGLQVATRAMKVRFESENGRLQSYEDTWLAPYSIEVAAESAASAQDQTNLRLRREAFIAVARHASEEERVAGKKAVDSANAALAGIALVRKGHGEMRANVDRLTSEQVTSLLKRTAEDLRDVRDNLQKL
jgi:hypothetical protein